MSANEKKKKLWGKEIVSGGDGREERCCMSRQGVWMCVSVGVGVSVFMYMEQDEEDWRV